MDISNLKQEEEVYAIQKPKHNASGQRASRSQKVEPFTEIEEHYEGIIDVDLALLDPFQSIDPSEPDDDATKHGNKPSTINICRVSQESSRYYVLQGAQMFREVQKRIAQGGLQKLPARVFNTSILNEPLLQIWIYKSQNVNGRQPYRVGDVLSLLSPHKARSELALRSAARHMFSKTLQQSASRIFRGSCYEKISRIFASNGPFAMVVLGDVYFLIQPKTEKYIALTHQLLDDLDRQYGYLRSLPQDQQRDLYSRLAASNRSFTYSVPQKVANDPAECALRPKDPYVFGEVLFCPSSFGRPLRILYHGWILRVHMLCLFTGSSPDSCLDLISNSVEGSKVLRALMAEKDLAVDPADGPDVDAKSQDWTVPQLARESLLGWAKSRVKKESLPSWSRLFQQCSNLGLPLSSDGASVMDELLSMLETPKTSIQLSEDAKNSSQPNPEGKLSLRTDSRSLKIIFPGSTSKKTEVLLADTVAGKTRTITLRSVGTSPPSESFQVKTHVTFHADPASPDVMMDDHTTNNVATNGSRGTSDGGSTPPPTTPSDDAQSRMSIREGSPALDDPDIPGGSHESPDPQSTTSFMENEEELPPISFGEACNDLSPFWLAFETDARVRQYWTPKLVQWMREDYHAP